MMPNPLAMTARLPKLKECGTACANRLFQCAVLSGGITEIKHLTAFVETTVRANTVRHRRLVTVIAFNQLWCADSIVGATAITTAFAQFAFW
jgi:hypothetical protein